MRYIIIMVFLLAAMCSNAQKEYPKITGFVAIVHPIVTFSRNETTTNFSDYYLAGMPTGINLWKNSRIGFSFEVVPYIKVENGVSKMTTLLFHPGILVDLKDGYKFAGRAAFETTGRYGVTPSIIKTVKKAKNCSYFISVPMPFRFGNEKPMTFTLGFLFGVSF